MNMYFIDVNSSTPHTSPFTLHTWIGHGIFHLFKGI